MAQSGGNQRDEIAIFWRDKRNIPVQNWTGRNLKCEIRLRRETG
jgi:hypothetical protein